MAYLYPNCNCPGDSKLQTMAKINNGLVNLFTIMSAGTFVGQLVNVFGCMCSEAQVLASTNNNIANFFSWFANNGGDVVDPTIHSWSDLAGIATVNMAVKSLKIWVDDTSGVLMATQLLTATDATDTSSGIQRPSDYADPGNTKVWFQKLA